LFFIFGLTPAFAQIADPIRSGSFALSLYKVFSNRVLSSFLAGVIFASLIYIMILVRHPMHLYPSLFRPPSEAFSRFASRDPNGTYQESYSKFKRRLDLSKKTFFSALLTLVVQVLAFIIFSLIVLQVSSDTNAKGKDHTDVKLAGAGICIAGEKETEPCGRCGTKTRVCLSGYFGEYSQCTGEGECVSGEKEEVSCSVGDASGLVERTCSNQCKWKYDTCEARGIVTLPPPPQERLVPDNEASPPYAFGDFRITSMNGEILTLFVDQLFNRPLKVPDNEGVSIIGKAPSRSKITLWIQSKKLVRSTESGDSGIWRIDFPKGLFEMGWHEVYGYFATESYYSRTFLLARFETLSEAQEKFLEPQLERQLPDPSYKGENIPTESNSGLTIPAKFISFFEIVRGMFAYDIFQTWKSLRNNPWIFIGSFILSCFFLLLHIFALSSALGRRLRSQLFCIFGSQPKYFFGTRKSLVRNQYGTVYDAITKLPIPLTVVRLTSEDGRKLSETFVTDSLGRYSFSAKPGKHTLQVTNTSFLFPSEIMKEKVYDNPFRDLYHGEVIEILEEEDTLSYDVPLDPKDSRETDSQLIRRSKMARIYASSSFFCTVIAFVCVVFNFYTFFLWFIHVLLRKFFLPFVPRGMVQPFGVILDSLTKKPLANAVIRGYDAVHNRLIYSAVSDALGRYPVPGVFCQFMFSVQCRRYHALKTEIFDGETWRQKRLFSFELRKF
jgi:hypothetical protein